MNRILFCGYGWAARRLWTPTLVARGFGVIGVIDPNPKLDNIDPSVEVRRHQAIGDLDADDYGIAIIASPNATHAHIAEALLARGLRVVVEKPVCTQLSDVERLQDASETGGGRLLRSASALYDEHLTRFAEVLVRERVGRPQSTKVSWIRANGVPGSQSATSSQYAVAGSSIDLGWHLLEWALSLSGYAPYTVHKSRFEAYTDRAASVGATWYSNASVDSGIDVDVAASINLRRDGASPIDLTTAWCSDRLGDTVVLETTHGQTTVRLTTMLGMSPDVAELPSIEIRRDGAISRLGLHSKQPGAAHAAMVDDLVDNSFEPASVGQNWTQLRALTGTTESIVSAHRAWRAQYTKQGE